MRAGARYDDAWLADQPMAQRLAREWPVLYLDPPLSIARAYREGRVRGLWSDRLQAVGPGLVRLRLFAPPSRHRGMLVAVTDLLVRWQLRSALRRLRRRVDVVLSIADDPFLRVLDTDRFVYWARDDFTSGATLMGVPARRLEAADERVAARADAVVAVSEPLVEKWRRLGREPVHIPNGCDARSLRGARRRPRPRDVLVPPPIIGYLGGLSERIDLGLLETLAEHGHSLLLLGARQQTLATERVERLLSFPNVQWLGSRPHEEIAPYLGAMRVGLVPYTRSAFNRASFPLKTLEYLAAGLPVVATDLPAIRWLDFDDVRIASGTARYVQAVDEALRAPDGPTERTRRQQFAAQHDWDERARTMATVLRGD